MENATQMQGTNSHRLPQFEKARKRSVFFFSSHAAAPLPNCHIPAQVPQSPTGFSCPAIAPREILVEGGLSLVETQKGGRDERWV